MNSVALVVGLVYYIFYADKLEKSYIDFILNISHILNEFN